MYRVENSARYTNEDYTKSDKKTDKWETISLTEPEVSTKISESNLVLDPAPVKTFSTVPTSLKHLK